MAQFLAPNARCDMASATARLHTRLNHSERPAQGQLLGRIDSAGSVVGIAQTTFNGIDAFIQWTVCAAPENGYFVILLADMCTTRRWLRTNKSKPKQGQTMDKPRTTQDKPNRFTYTFF